MIPRYDKQNIDTSVVTRKTRGMSEQAEAQGQAGVAQGQARLGAQQGQRANQEIASFANRLNMFTQTLDRNMKVHSKQKAEQDASQKIIGMKNEIRNIEENTTLDDSTKAQKIDEARLRLKDVHYDVYSAAYANAVQADFNNQITLDSQAKAIEAAEASKGRPEMFKEAYRKYEKELLDTAPDSASRLVAKRAFDKQGMSTYKGLYKADASRRDKEAQDRAKITSERLSTQYSNEMTNGDLLAADETQTQFNVNQQTMANKGYITQNEANDNMYKLNVESQQIKTQTTFNKYFEAGQGPEAYEQIKAMNDNGAFNHWEGSKRNSLMTGMETKLSQRANDIFTNTKKAFTNGNMPTERELNEAEEYLPYMSEQNQRQYNIQKDATKAYHGIKDFKLQEQIVEVRSLNAREDLTLEEREKVAGLNKVVEQKVAKAKSDQISLGNEEGLFNADFITPSKTSKEMMQKRYLESGAANTQYGFEQQFFTQPETEGIKDFMADPNISAHEKLDFISKIDQGTNGNSQVAFEQMNKKGVPLFSAAGDLVNEGRPGVALNVMKGQQAFNEGTLNIDTKTLQKDISDEFGNSFFLAGAGDAAKSKAAVQALYAYYVSKGEDPDIEDVTEEVLGQKGNHSNQDFYAPTGVDAGDVEDFFEEQNSANMKPILGIKESEYANAIDRSKPMHMGKGVYRFIFQGKTLQNVDGTPYELEYINAN